MHERERRELFDVTGKLDKPRAPYSATAGKLKLFLGYLSDHGILTRAARQAGITKDSIYRYKLDSPEFARKLKTAMTLGRRSLEDIAHDRAIFGIEQRQEKYDAEGNLVETVITHKHDNRLLVDVLRVRGPGRWAAGNRNGEPPPAAPSETDGDGDFRYAGKDIEEVRVKVLQAIQALSAKVLDATGGN